MTEMFINIAHQWRQPLNLISTIISAIKLEKDLGIENSENQKIQLSNALEKVLYLSSTIDSFNEFIRKDSNKKSFSLHDCLDSTLTVLNSTLEYENIEDNAGGIDKNIINKIFDIYFTTKHQSQGTGLGLYISYEIIQKYFNGKLYVENSDSGAKFIIELPII